MLPKAQVALCNPEFFLVPLYGSPPLLHNANRVTATFERLSRWRVVCFPNAGNAEDMYTSEGTGARKVSSPLLVSIL